MAYAIRFTNHIENDIERGWSAWMEPRFSSFEALLDEHPGIDTEDVEERWERWQDESWQPWFHRDTECREEFAEDFVLDVLGWDYRRDPRRGFVVEFHHEGLSCYAIDDPSEAEAKLDEVTAHGIAFGQSTIGDVRAVKVIGHGYDENGEIIECWLLECEDTEDEALPGQP